MRLVNNAASFLSGCSSAGDGEIGGVMSGVRASSSSSSSSSRLSSSVPFKLTVATRLFVFGRLARSM